uniref:GDNF family receptor alpha like n=1 Tax=Jaculus jaculus TaxID=51337 RepID=A0A8C5KZ07_JACJA
MTICYKLVRVLLLWLFLTISALKLSSENETPFQTNDCAQLMEQCLQDANDCEHAWRQMDDACHASGDSCKIKNSSHCNLGIQSFVETNVQFKECLCTGDLHCTLNKFLGKKCINTSDNIKEENKFKENQTILFHQGFEWTHSCLEVTEACVEDVVCNTHLALYLKACSANGDLCDVKHCQAAIRFFYQNMPLNTAQMLAFCDCAQSDITCQQSKEALHSKPCAVNRVPPPTCLNVIHSCRNDELCRKHYTIFLSKCWPHVTAKCKEDVTCASMLNGRDLTCSGSDACREAHIGLLGTVLQVQCTCKGTTQHEESLCKTSQHILHRKSCFSNSTFSVIFLLLIASLNAVNFVNCLFLGEVLYAVTCMAVACGIIIYSEGLGLSGEIPSTIEGPSTADCRR